MAYSTGDPVWCKDPEDAWGRGVSVLRPGAAAAAALPPTAAAVVAAPTGRCFGASSETSKGYRHSKTITLVRL